jgi:aminopeptidase YwaD
MFKYLFLVFCLLSGLFFRAQDLDFTKKIISSLTAEKYHGRGYVHNGCNKACSFLEKQFKQMGLNPINNIGHRQSFHFSVNTFPKRVQLFVDGKSLFVGRDFILNANSAPFHGEVLLLLDSSKKYFVNKEKTVMLKLTKKLTFSASTVQSKLTEFVVLLDSSKAWQKENQIKVKAKVDTKYFDNYEVFNLVGKVNGTADTDSTIVVSAHYDHLGRLGKYAYFPGANDNASGVSMLLNLAKAIQAKPLKYNVVFILFAGEEIGLLGSKYFTDNPLIDLKQIKFLVNLDLNGTGDDGATVVNSTIFKTQFELLKSINDQQKLLPQLKTRGKAANSDHYWFSEKGVPAFFIYTMGGIAAYHDIDDKAETLPLTKYKELHQLLLSFIQQL